MPWAPDVQVVYKHLHRYLRASQLAPGRRALDLASGEGFGAAMLAETAASAVGIDIDERSIEHARLNYAAPNLEYRVADARDLSDFADDSFEMVVPFEMIEHVADQAQVIDEIRRVLTPDGVAIIPTPERGAYSEATGQQNPFHVRELTRAEFIALLGGDFATSQHGVSGPSRALPFLPSVRRSENSLRTRRRSSWSARAKNGARPKPSRRSTSSSSLPQSNCQLCPRSRRSRILAWRSWRSRGSRAPK